MRIEDALDSRPDSVLDMTKAEADDARAQYEARQSDRLQLARATATARDAIETRLIIESAAKWDVDAAYLLVQRCHNAVLLADRDGTVSEQEGTRGELRHAIEQYRTLLESATHADRTAHRERLIADVITEAAVVARCRGKAAQRGVA